MARIAIIDDHAMFRDSVAALLSPFPEFSVCGSFSNLADAFREIPAVKPDLVLLDLALAHERGSEFLRWAATHHAPFRVLVVTGYTSPDEIRSLLILGASGVILKTGTGEQLLAAVRSVLTGQSFLDPAFEEPANLAPAERGVFSSRERQVFQAMYAGKSNKEIASEFEISESAVKATLQRIFDKTGVRTRGQLVRAALEDFPDLLRPPSAPG